MTLEYVHIFWWFIESIIYRRKTGKLHFIKIENSSHQKTCFWKWINYSLGESIYNPVANKRHKWRISTTELTDKKKKKNQLKWAKVMNQQFKKETYTIGL